MSKINSKKTIIDNIEFDSQTEAEYYQYLKSCEDIERFEMQPQFTFIKPFHIVCGRCIEGKVPSPKTGNLINCKTCEGTGKRKRKPWTYKADFQVFYKDGRVEVVDVKGFANERFLLVRKMFEYKFGKELIVVKKTKTGWKYV